MRIRLIYQIDFLNRIDSQNRLIMFENYGTKNQVLAAARLVLLDDASALGISK